MERSVVQFGKTRLAYAIHRTQREKTVAVAVDPVRGIEVRAPRSTSIERLDQIVRRKAKWIVERRRRQEDLPPAPRRREFVNGETFLYLGRQYRLKIEAVDTRGEAPHVRLAGRWLLVRRGRDSGDSSREVRDLLVAWYREHARRRFPERVQFWSTALRAQPAGVLVRDQRKRWGSADANGVVRFNWRISQAPISLVDYVVAHELVHLEHPDHTREFWAKLGQVMPDYEGRREELRVLGPSIVW